MKPIIELMNTPRLCVDGRIPQAPLEAEVYSGWLDAEGTKYCVIFDYNEPASGRHWEHVSISHRDKHRIPDWETMRRVKEMFWDMDVTLVHVRGAGDRDNVSHLWRAKDGD